MRLLNFCRNALKYAGYLPPEHIIRWKKTVYFMYTFLAYSLVLGIYITSQLTDLYKIWGDIDAMTADAFLLFTNLAQTAKLFNIFIRHDQVLNVYNKLHDLNKLHGNSPAKLKIIEGYSKTGMKFLYTYFFLSYVTLAMWAISPIFMAAKGTRLLPLNAWYPYDTSVSPAYELTYFQQTFPLTLSATLNMVSDMLPISLMSEIQCQFELLKHELVHLVREPPKITINNKETEETDSNIFEPYDDTENLNKCIEHHQEIFDIVEEVEDCFKYTTFFQFSVSLVIICVTEYQLAQSISVKVVPAIIIGMATYLFDMIFQVFIYCWHGNQVILQSHSITDAAYETLWYKASPRFRKSLQVLMARTFCPVVLTAGKFAILSLNVFTGILKISYSCFSLLQYMSDDTEM